MTARFNTLTKHFIYPLFPSQSINLALAHYNSEKIKTQQYYLFGILLHKCFLPATKKIYLSFQQKDLNSRITYANRIIDLIYDFVTLCFSINP